MVGLIELMSQRIVDEITEDAWQELLALGYEDSFMPVTDEMKNLVRRMGDRRTANEAQMKFCSAIKPAFRIEAGIGRLMLSEPCEDYRVIVHSSGVAYKHLQEGRWDILRHSISSLARRVKMDLKDEGSYHHMTFCPRVSTNSEDPNFGDEFTMVACIYLP